MLILILFTLWTFRNISVFVNLYFSIYLSIYLNLFMSIYLSIYDDATWFLISAFVNFHHQFNQIRWQIKKILVSFYGIVVRYDITFNNFPVCFYYLYELPALNYLD